MEKAMKILIIGGTGHIGGFLTDLLVADGQQVVVMASGRTPPRKGIELVAMRYADALNDGSFRALLQQRKFDAVVDILQGDARTVYSACVGSGVSHLVACGSLWMFGRPKVVPTPEQAQTECPFEGYRKRFREMQETLAQAKSKPCVFSAIMPPNICGPGKIPLDGRGGRSIEVHRAHQRGEAVPLPFPGTNLVGPCDAEDVARGFFCAIQHRQAAAGEIFNVGSAYALTSEKFIQTYAGIYETKIPIRLVSPEKYAREILPDVGANFHFLEPMCPDISRISSRLGYRPRYTPEQTMERAVRWMRDQKLL